MGRRRSIRQSNRMAESVRFRIGIIHPAGLACPERQRAIVRIADFVAPGGLLLVLARGRDANEEKGLMPWPLTPDEIRSFENTGLSLIKLEDYLDDESPPVRRFRATFRR